MNHPEIDFISARNILFRNSEAGLATFKALYGSNDDLKAQNEADWFPFRSSSMNTDNVLDTIEARKTPGEFNVIRDFPDGKREFSRFSNGNLKWEVEQTPNSLEGYTNRFVGKNEWCLHSRLEGHTIKLSLNHKNGNNRITIIDNETNKIISQETLSKDMALKRYVDMHEKIAIKGLQRKIKEMKESHANNERGNTNAKESIEPPCIENVDRGMDITGPIEPPCIENVDRGMDITGPIEPPCIENIGMNGALEAGASMEVASMDLNLMQMQQFGGR